MGAPRFRISRYRNVCRYCRQEFDAKTKNTAICYREECQAQVAVDARERARVKRATMREEGKQ